MIVLLRPAGGVPRAARAAAEHPAEVGPPRGGAVGRGGMPEAVPRPIRDGRPPPGARVPGARSPVPAPARADARRPQQVGEADGRTLGLRWEQIARVVA